CRTARAQCEGSSAQSLSSRWLDRSPVALAVGAGGQTLVTLEKIAEEGDVVVAEGKANFLDGHTVFLEHPLGGLGPQTLKIGERRLAGRRLETAKDAARRDRQILAELVEVDVVRKVVVQPFLAAADGGVAVFAAQRKDRKACLV